MRKLRLFDYYPSIVNPHRYPVISQWILQILSLSAFRIVILHCYFCYTTSPEQNFQSCMFFSISFSSTIEKSKEVFLIFYLFLAYQMLKWQDLYIYFLYEEQFYLVANEKPNSWGAMFFFQLVWKLYYALIILTKKIVKKMVYM